MNEHKQSKIKIIVLSDRQGQNIHPYIQNLIEEFVYGKPGARLKNVIKYFIEDCSKNDIVVLLSGTNDIGRYKPRVYYQSLKG